MKKIYKIDKNEITITDISEFDIEHILDCGQIFTYKRIGDDFIVYSDKDIAVVRKVDDFYKINTSNVEYFVNFFDLDTDYAKIKNEVKTILESNKFGVNIDEMYRRGGGIRILRQSFLETVIGFIISANNNISRIKKSMQYIRENLGTKTKFGDFEYFAFPCLESLAMQNETFFQNAGCGYRSASLVKTIKMLQGVDIDNLCSMSTQNLREYLLNFAGVGPKVVDCILLFCFSRTDVFPVDTWVKKIYKDLFGEESKENVMRQNLINKFSGVAGYAQQYLFYFKRVQSFEKKNIDNF